MKKIVLLAIILIPLFGFAQGLTDEASIKKHEVSLNIFNLIAFKTVDVSYEYIINEESSAGVSLLTKLGKDNVGINPFLDFALTPHYRYYFFDDGYAKGFFMETFLMVNNGKKEIYDATGSYEGDEQYTDAAFGIGIGGKFVSKRGFTGQIYLGLGRNLFNSAAEELVLRLGVSLGYRF